MSTRKEEERNEKIIRGLMKLPPNRRCINCNSLGPQYVCTNFWTFVCMTCSGIHREFTHRVKSVSMAKFTSQEVEALQNGGNQRARETYLNDWDPQRQRLPDSSKVDKVREFIKAVYVDKRYAGGKTSEKPPKNTQGLGSREDETRRASSYHSYSQSPPYDYQYEDRRYGKQHASLTRKPGSDRGYYVGKMSSFIYSPGRMSEQMFEDRFANEGSGSRVSDYSVSSGGDPFRSGAESPGFEKDIGFNSPPKPSRDISSSTANFKRDLEGIPRPQRTTSLGSMGSFDSNSMSLKPYNSGGFVDVTSEPEQAAGIHQDKMSTLPKSSSPVKYGGLDLFQPSVASESTHQDKMSTLSQSSGPVNYGGLDLFQPSVASESTHQDKMSTLPQSSGPVNYGGLDLFQPSVASESFSSAAPPIDLFQLPAASAAPVNLVQTSQATSTPSVNSYQPSQTSSLSSLDLFQISEQPSTINLDGKSQESSNPKNEGWATFDTFTPATSISGTESITPAIMPGNEGSSVKFNQFPSFDTSMQWPAFQNSSAQGPFPSSGLLFDGLHNVQTPTMATSAEPWNAFDDSTNHLPLEGVVQNCEPQLAASKPSSTADQYLSFIVSKDSNHDGTSGAASRNGPPGPTLPSHVEISPSYTPVVLPLMGETQAHANDLKSKNPFDFPYDSDLEQSNTNDVMLSAACLPLRRSKQFLDMSSLQAALPNAHLPSTFLGGANQPWFPQDPATSFIPAAGQGGLAYMSGQAPSSQLANVAAQEPVASVGGNPFA